MFLFLCQMLIFEKIPLIDNLLTKDTVDISQEFFHRRFSMGA